MNEDLLSPSQLDNHAPAPTPAEMAPAPISASQQQERTSPTDRLFLSPISKRNSTRSAQLEVRFSPSTGIPSFMNEATRTKKRRMTTHMSPGTGPSESTSPTLDYSTLPSDQTTFIPISSSSETPITKSRYSKTTIEKNPWNSSNLKRVQEAGNRFSNKLSELLHWQKESTFSESRSIPSTHSSFSGTTYRKRGLSRTYTQNPTGLSLSTGPDASISGEELEQAKPNGLFTNSLTHSSSANETASKTSEPTNTTASSSTTWTSATGIVLNSSTSATGTTNAESSADTATP